MELRNCPSCGRLFQYTNNKLCPDCVKRLDEEFKRVRDYLEDHPRATVEEVSRETGVRPDRILAMIRSGRIIATEGIGAQVVCQGCGKPIPFGRFCRECAGRLQHKLADAIKEQVTDQRTIRTWKERQ